MALSASCLLAGVLLPTGVKAAAPKVAPQRAEADNSLAGVSEVDRLLAEANSANKAPKPAPVVDDLSFLRRISIDLIGRIPTQAEVIDFQGQPAATRRAVAIDRMLADPRFTDKWTVFFADMLRIRTGAEGGGAYLAFVHQALEQSMPYDQMCKQLISANGRANVVPEVGFILGDAADPMALAGATAQTFLGMRIACAQCHDHPFDVWKREQFYGLAAYYGLTTRVERRFKMNLLGVYTTEVAQTSILWPPEGKAKPEERKPMKPSFPFTLEQESGDYIERLAKLRKTQEKAKVVASAKKDEASLDDLLDAAEQKVKKTTTGAEDDDAVKSEAKSDVRSVNLAEGGRSQLRSELADYITTPRNKQFSRSLVNRVWAELLGLGFVNPVDDFTDENKPSHPKLLNYLAEEFIAQGYDIRKLVRMIVTSDAYQRGRLTGIDDPTRRAAETAFVSTPVRRMTSEVLFDSIVLAGHLFDVKHEAGKNMKTQWVMSQVEKKKDGKLVPTALGGKMAKGGDGMAMKADGAAPAKGAKKGYDLESALELDFGAVLKQAQSEKNDEPEVEEMEMVSKEQLEAEEELAKMRKRSASYIDRYMRAIVDDNPKFPTALRMASPADPTHFLRVFGQPARDQLGQARDSSATMRQALMMLNGRLTHEASRVGELEPIYPLVAGKKPDLKKAVELVYLELFTREPKAAEVQEGIEIINGGETVKDGVADLRWVLFNSHEFRFIP